MTTFKLLQYTTILSLFILPNQLFAGDDVPKTHCIKKEESNRHHTKVRLRVNYDDNLGYETHATWLHNDTYPNSKNKFEEPGDASNETYCYKASDQVDYIDVDKFDAFLELKIEVQRGFDCKTWDLEQPSAGLPDSYTFANKTQNYSLHYYHLGIHTHCHLGK